MAAHYAEAVPKDLLKTEMDRLTREIASAEREQQAARGSVTELETQLERALVVASNCATHYTEATPAVRRMMNQGFFSKLYISEDGDVERADLTEPFAQVLSREPGQAPGGSQSRTYEPDGTGRMGNTTDKIETAQSAVQVSVITTDLTRSSLVLTCASRHSDLEKTQGRLTPALGLNVNTLVGPVGVEPTLART